MNRLDPILDTLRSLFEQHVLPRYQALSHRDQRVLLILALFLAVALPLFGLILPLHDKLVAEREHIVALKVQAGEAARLADQLQKSGPVSGGVSVMSMVDRIARSNGVREFMTRIRPQVGGGGGESLQVHMKNAPYRESVKFLAALADAGLNLSQLKLQAAESAGHIHFQAVISGG